MTQHQTRHRMRARAGLRGARALSPTPSRPSVPLPPLVWAPGWSLEPISRSVWGIELEAASEHVASHVEDTRATAAPLDVPVQLELWAGELPWCESYDRTRRPR